MTTQSHRQSRHHPQTVEIIVIGAGFGDIYAVQEFADELGPSLTGFDESGDPRGAWHWNRFPGALCDTESHRYRFVRRGPAGQHLEGLLRHQAVDHSALRRHVRFGPENEVTTAVHLDEAALGEVTTEARTSTAPSHVGARSRPSCSTSAGRPTTARSWTTS